MNNLFKIVSIIGLTVITQTAYSAAVTDTFTTGDTLTAEKLNNIKSAVNANDTRMDSISSCVVTENEGTASITCTSESGDTTIASVSDGATATGTTEGDMQYWDGSDWVVVPTPTDTTVESTLRFVNDKPTWIYTPSYYQIGDPGPAGGFVFFVTDGGLHGLEAAPVDQSTDTAWGCDGQNVTNAVGTDIGFGTDNTTAILDEGGDCSKGSAAATAASDYEVSGYADWFLPSRDELSMMFNVIGCGDVGCSLGNQGGFELSKYWSSSQTPSQYAAYNVRFSDGLVTDSNNKMDEFNVRAVRDF
jgi:hypothetical protein